jgi:hypothetical protein
MATRSKTQVKKSAANAAALVKRTAAKPKPETTTASSPSAAKGRAAVKRAAIPVAPAKPVKLKLVRDSFTIPSTEYEVLDRLKRRAVTLAHPVKKSEVLRAGIKALDALSGAAFLQALEVVPVIKTGRPKAKKSEKSKATPGPDSSGTKKGGAKKNT